MAKNRLPAERRGFTHRAIIGGQKIYIRTGEYENGLLGEVFITIDKEGHALRVYDALGILISVGLQHGVPLADLVDKLMYLRYDPQGPTNNEKIPITSSIADYLAKWLSLKYNKQIQKEINNGQQKNVRNQKNRHRRIGRRHRSADYEY